MATLVTPQTTTPADAGAATTSTKPGANLRIDELKKRIQMHDHTFIASVLEVNQQLQSYLLRSSMKPDIMAISLDQAGRSAAFGGRSSHLYSVGTLVLAMTIPTLGGHKALILGAIPPHSGAGEAIVTGAEELIASSPVGAQRDSISDSGILNAVLNNYNDGRPVDAYPGDTVWTNGLGGNIRMGPLHVALSYGLDCAVELHHIDSLLRLQSFNFEQSTCSSETLGFSDGGDFTQIHRVNPYVVESLGAAEPYGDVPSTEGEARNASDKTVLTGNMRPQDEEQIGWWRLQEFDGYLANLKTVFISTPVTPKLRTASVQGQDEVGLFREHIDSSGAYTVASAKSISFIKDCLIPVPRERYRSDDSRGDDDQSIVIAREENAKNLKDFTIEGLESEAAHSALLYSAASSDAAAFKTHRSLVHFRERAKDWTLNEVEQIDLAGFKDHLSSSGYISAATGVTKSSPFAKLPKVGTLQINPREEVKYFASRSMVMMHEDGSIHLQDGYGSTISMRAGGIDISCPGDITLRSGKNVISIAGDTFTAVAGADVELAANIGDVRIQADRNVSVLSGNDGTGGILLESKAEASNVLAEDDERFKNPKNNANSYGGVWFKAVGSSVCAVGKEVYMGNAAQPCQLYLDPGPTGNFTIRAATSAFLCENTIFTTDYKNPASATNFIISPAGGGIQSDGAFFIQSSGLLGLPRHSAFNLQMDGSALFSKSVMANIFASPTPQVSEIKKKDMDESVKKSKEALSQYAKVLDKFIQAQGDRFDLLGESVVGKTDSSLKNLTFCYPDSELRGVASDVTYIMFESDWQQQYRSQGAGAKLKFKGVDPAKPSGATPVGVSESRTYFWPGAEALNKKFGKLEYTNRYVTDKLVFKSSGFDKPVTLTPTALSFEDNYTVISENQLRTKQ